MHRGEPAAARAGNRLNWGARSGREARFRNRTDPVVHRPAISRVSGSAARLSAGGRGLNPSGAKKRKRVLRGPALRTTTRQYGHRNNPRGYADALEEFDARLPGICAALRDGDVLILTADHGNDPTTPSTDHSRERVPILVAGSQIRAGTNLGTRDSFADVAATIADLLGIVWDGAGESMAGFIIGQ